MTDQEASSLPTSDSEPQKSQTTPDSSIPSDELDQQTTPVNDENGSILNSDDLDEGTGSTPLDDKSVTDVSGVLNEDLDGSVPQPDVSVSQSGVLGNVSNPLSTQSGVSGTEVEGLATQSEVSGTQPGLSGSVSAQLEVQGSAKISNESQPGSQNVSNPLELPVSDSAVNQSVRTSQSGVVDTEALSAPKDVESIQTSDQDQDILSTLVEPGSSQRDESDLRESATRASTNLSTPLEESERVGDQDEDTGSKRSELVTELSQRSDTGDSLSPSLSPTQSPIITDSSVRTTEPSAATVQASLKPLESGIQSTLQIETAPSTQTITEPQTISAILSPKNQTPEFDSMLREDNVSEPGSRPIGGSTIQTISPNLTPAIKVEESVFSETISSSPSVRSQPETTTTDSDEDQTQKPTELDILSQRTPTPTAILSPVAETSLPSDDIRPLKTVGESSNISVSDSTAASIGKILSPQITHDEVSHTSLPSGYLRDSQKMSQKSEVSPWMKVAQARSKRSGGPIMIGDSTRSVEEESAVHREYHDTESASGVSKLTIGGSVSTRSHADESFKTKILQPSPPTGIVPTFETQSQILSIHIDSNATDKSPKPESAVQSHMTISSHVTEKKESEKMTSEISLGLYPSTITGPVILSELTSPLFKSEMTSQASNMAEMSHHADAHVSQFETHHLAHHTIKSTFATVNLDQSARVKLHDDGSVTAVKEGEDGQEEEVTLVESVNKTVVYGGLLALLMITL